MSAPDATIEAPAATETKKNEPRPYFVTSKASIDLSADPATIIAALETLVPDAQTVEVFAVVGSPKALSPLKAIKELGKDQDLQGDFHVIAENSVTEFKDVKIGTERVVRVG